MGARILDGKRIAADIRSSLAREVERLTARAGRPPGLAAVLVGDDPASATYVRTKTKACAEVGIVSRHHALPADTSLATLLSLVDDLNADPAIHGILIQLPLPPHLPPRTVLDRVSPEKDVDGFTAVNMGRLLQGSPLFVPCTPAGVLEILDREKIPVAGTRAVVVGRSDIVGKPMALLLLHRHATVTICHSRTANLGTVTREADLLVVATGRAGLLTGDMVREGTVVIDVGQNRVGGRLVGDVDFASVAPRASAITPVPGGVGPMTVAMLLVNTVAACARTVGA